MRRGGKHSPSRFEKSSLNRMLSKFEQAITALEGISDERINAKTKAKEKALKQFEKIEKKLDALTIDNETSDIRTQFQAARERFIEAAGLSYGRKKEPPSTPLAEHEIKREDIAPFEAPEEYAELDAAIEGRLQPESRPENDDITVDDEKDVSHTAVADDIEEEDEVDPDPYAEDEEDVSDETFNLQQQVIFDRLHKQLVFVEAMAQREMSNENPQAAKAKLIEAQKILAEMITIKNDAEIELPDKFNIKAKAEELASKISRMTALAEANDIADEPQQNELEESTLYVDIDDMHDEMELHNEALYNLLDEYGILPEDDEDNDLIEELYSITPTADEDIEARLEKLNEIRDILNDYRDRCTGLLEPEDLDNLGRKIINLELLLAIYAGNQNIAQARAMAAGEELANTKEVDELDELLQKQAESGEPKPADLDFDTLLAEIRTAPPKPVDELDELLQKQAKSGAAKTSDLDLDALLEEIRTDRQEDELDGLLDNLFAEQPVDDKGKGEAIVTEADRQLRVITDSIAALNSQIIPVRRALKNQHQDPDELAHISATVSDISRRALSLRENIQALAAADQKPDPAALRSAHTNVGKLLQKCEAAVNVIQVKNHEMGNQSQTQKILGDWRSIITQLNSRTNEINLRLNDRSLTAQQANTYLSQLERDDQIFQDFVLRNTKELRGKMNGQESNAFNELRQQSGECLQAQWQAIELAQSKIHQLTLAPPPPPPPPPAPPIIDRREDPYFIFAKNAVEYDQRKQQVIHIHTAFSNCQQKADRAILAADGLTKTATTENVRGKITDTIDTQLHELKLYKGLMEDNIRRKNDPAAANPNKPGEHREAGFDAANISNTTVAAMQQRLADTDQLIEKLQRARNNIQALTVAPSHFSIYKKSIHAQSMLGNNTGINFHEPQSFSTRDAALGAAQQFFSVYGRRPPDNSMNSLYGVNLPPSQSVAKNTFVFNATEANTKRGSIPVGILQETNPEQTFSRQEVIINPAELKSLNELPFASKAKEEKIKEQLIFVSNMIETGLAAVKTNGPVTLEHWPANLQKVAAAYCKEMGYDLRPKSLIDNMKPKEMETLRGAVRNMANDNPQFSAFIHDAEKRKDLKESQLPQTSPRPR